MNAGLAHLDVHVRVAAVLIPVALYFLALGLLNSRRHPQLLPGRRDFALLLLALGPLLLLPMLSLHWSVPATVGLAAAVAAVLWLLAPRPGTWVLYNLTPAEADRAVDRALDAAGLDARRDGRRWRLPDSGAALEVRDFHLLRNVTVRMTGGDAELHRRFENALAARLARVEAETTPTAMALLLVAAAMLVAPLVAVAPRAGEIVRMLTGMLY